MALKYTPNIGNYPVYNSYHNLPGALYSLKSFKCIFPSENDILKTGTSKREQRITDLKIVNPGGFPGGAVVENLPANAGDTGSSPGLGRSHMPRSN